MEYKISKNSVEYKIYFTNSKGVNYTIDLHPQENSVRASKKRIELRNCCITKDIPMWGGKEHYIKTAPTRYYNIIVEDYEIKEIRKENDND